ncbi:hypothetical protein JCM6882_003463 [Rhodosporidiobolus microsporus]
MPPTTASTTAGVSRRPFIPTFKVPLEAVPSLLPWSLLVERLLPFAPPTVLAFFPSLAPLPQVEPAWSASLEQWYHVFALDVWRPMEEDAEMDEAALFWFEVHTGDAERQGSDTQELQRDIMLLRTRIVDRWLRLYGLSIGAVLLDTSYRDGLPSPPLDEMWKVWPLSTPPPRSSLDQLTSIEDFERYTLPEIDTLAAAAAYTDAFGSKPATLHSFA